jgi:hypothetical protein
MSSTTHALARRSATILTVTLIAAIGGCGDKSKHASDGDTGAAAPATMRDMSATPNVGDSTRGVSNPTGQPDAASGDTTGSRRRDSTPGAAGGSPVRGTRP